MTENPLRRFKWHESVLFRYGLLLVLFNQIFRAATKRVAYNIYEILTKLLKAKEYMKSDATN